MLNGLKLQVELLQMVFVTSAFMVIQLVFVHWQYLEQFQILVLVIFCYFLFFSLFFFFSIENIIFFFISFPIFVFQFFSSLIRDFFSFQIANSCSSMNDNNAQWNQTASGIVANGICNFGYYGNPTRLCSLGTFGTISNPCTRNFIDIFFLDENIYDFLCFFFALT